MKRARSLSLMLALVVSVAGCASAGAGGTTPRSSSNNRNTLTTEQLASTNADNLYDAVSKLRPEWLTSRGAQSLTSFELASVDIYVDGSNLGKQESLRDIRLVDVREVKYWDAASASARFGMGHSRGVIEIIRK